MEILALIKRNRQEILRIAGKYGAHNVRLFGSTARGDRGPDSDIDLLVEFEPGVTLLKHAALVRELEALLNCKIDLVSENGLKPRIRESIIREAVSI